MKRQMGAEAPDLENPEWSAADSSRAVKFDALPETLQRKLRGRPKAVQTKERITIRLSPDVLEAFRGTGAGWQTRMDSVLREWVLAHKGKSSA